MQDQPPRVPDQETAPVSASNASTPASAENPSNDEPQNRAQIRARTDNQSGAQPKPGSAAGLEEQLRQAEQKAQEKHDAWLRAMAEVENVRRRAQIDLANAHRYAIEEMAAELLPVKDSLEAALSSENATFDALKSGVELTLKQLVAAFQKSTLSEINPLGEKFDPNRHHAMSVLASEKEPNTVINVLQKGYLLHERVIRPAMVIVAKPKDA
jgi:molecular chaperone GrpE